MITAEEGRQAEWNLLTSQPNKTSQKYCSLKISYFLDLISSQLGWRAAFHISPYFQHC
jgi:hypothetical protein